MTPESYLDTILAKKQTEIELLYDTVNFDTFLSQVNAVSSPRFLFSEALASPQLHLIAELKKASPSKGVIKPNFDPQSLAQQYHHFGARCLSILTEQFYFKGDPSYINDVKAVVSLPILRKDFIIDPIQVLDSKRIGAHAILLILAILDLGDAQHLLTTATEIGLDVIVETHSEEELRDALSLKGTFMIGINNRNLKTFDVDIELASRLKRQFQDQLASKIVIAESGYTQAKELSALHAEGFSAVLVGEGLVTHPDLADYFMRQ
jgi:indole-3-glycerol phosphate synthase